MTVNDDYSDLSDSFSAGPESIPEEVLQAGFDPIGTIETGGSVINDALGDPIGGAENFGDLALNAAEATYQDPVGTFEQGAGEMLDTAATIGSPIVTAYEVGQALGGQSAQPQPGFGGAYANPLSDLGMGVATPPENPIQQITDQFAAPAQLLGAVGGGVGAAVDGVGAMAGELGQMTENVVGPVAAAQEQLDAVEHAAGTDAQVVAGGIGNVANELGEMGQSLFGGIEPTSDPWAGPGQ